MIAEGIRLHVGCGLNTPQGWTHLDGSWNARLAKLPWLRKLFGMLRWVPQSQLSLPWNPNIVFHNVTRRLPFETSSVEAIYTSHLIEHLHLDEQKFFLKECFRVLKPNGILRAVVPDLKAIIDEYNGNSPFSSGPEAATAADRFMLRLSVRPPSPAQGHWLQRVFHKFWDLHSHKWMYDAESLSHYFKLAGFTQVRQLPLHSSSISDIARIEDPGRVTHGEGICIEGTKQA